jgi:hypothetical protein
VFIFRNYALNMRYMEQSKITNVDSGRERVKTSTTIKALRHSMCGTVKVCQCESCESTTGPKADAARDLATVDQRVAQQGPQDYWPLHAVWRRMSRPFHVCGRGCSDVRMSANGARITMSGGLLRRWPDALWCASGIGSTNVE